MTNPYRALCAELYREFSSLYGDMSARVDFNDSYEKRIDDLCDRAARALLDQPVAEGPTDEEIMELMPQQMRDDLAAAARALTGFERDIGRRLILNRHAVDHVRDALAKWGSTTPQLVAVSKHRAAPELWAAAEKWGANTMDMVNCILELRSRIELLEATQHAHFDTSMETPNNWHQ